MNDQKKRLVEAILSCETGAEAIAQATLFIMGAVDALHDEMMIMNNQLVDLNKRVKKLETKEKKKIILPS